MAYQVELTGPVRVYLAATDGLTDADRAAVIDGVIDELSRLADQFFSARPLAHESFLFRYDYYHPTRHTLFNFDFIGDAANLAMGVVRVVYVECSAEPMG